MLLTINVFNVAKTQLILFINNIDINSIIDNIIKLISSIENIFNIKLNSLNITNIFKDSLNNIISYILLFVNKVPNLLMSFFLVFVSSIFFTFDYYKIQKFIIKLIPTRYIKIFLIIKSTLIKNIKVMFKFQIKLMFITFLFLSVSFLLIKKENAILTSLTISIMDFFPLIGTGIYFIPSILIESTTNPTYSIQLLFIFLLVNILRNCIEPYILSSQVKVHPLFTIFSLYISVKCLGILGLLLSQIITITVVDVIRNFDKIKKFVYP